MALRVRSRSGPAGAREPKYCVRFDQQALSVPGPTSSQQLILTRVLALVDSLRCGWIRRDLLRLEGFFKVALLSETEGCSRIELYLYGDDDVGVAAGEGVYFNIPDDVSLPEGLDLPAYVERVVRAIAEGKLREIIYCGGAVSYRWVFRLDVNGHSITLDRTDVRSWFKALWRKRQRKTVSYVAYRRQDEQT